MNAVVGHERNIRYLEQILARGTVPHCFLFYGPARTGKRTVAGGLVRALLCERDSSRLDGAPECAADPCEGCRLARGGIHPDFLTCSPENGSDAGIAQARTIEKRLAESAWRGGRKVVLIDDAERLTGAAQSALLKTIEDPDPHTVFIFVTGILGAILPTVVSRAIGLAFGLVESSRMEALFPPNTGARRKRELLALARGRPGALVSMLSDPGTVRAAKQQPVLGAGGDVSRDRELLEEWIAELLWSSRDRLQRIIREGKKPGRSAVLRFLWDRMRDLESIRITGLNRKVIFDHIRFSADRLRHEHGITL